MPFPEDMLYLASGAGTAFRSKKRLKDITEEEKPHITVLYFECGIGCKGFEIPCFLCSWHFRFHKIVVWVVFENNSVEKNAIYISYLNKYYLQSYC